MNYFNFNPLEFTAKTVLRQNDRVRHLVSSISKVKALVHVNQLCNQIENYRRIALFASCCFSGEERREIHERCSHGINDCNNELRRLTGDALLDKAIERLTDKRNGYQY